MRTRVNHQDMPLTKQNRQYINMWPVVVASNFQERKYIFVEKGNSSFSFFFSIKLECLLQFVQYRTLNWFIASLRGIMLKQ